MVADLEAASNITMHIVPRVSINSEAFTSELIGTLGEMFPPVVVGHDQVCKLSQHLPVSKGSSFLTSYCGNALYVIYYLLTTFSQKNNFKN